MQTIVDDKYPVHFVNAWTKNLALCGSGWLQATGSEELVTCPDCKRLLTQRAPDALRAHDMGEVAGVKLTYVKGNVFATPAKRR